MLRKFDSRCSLKLDKNASVKLLNDVFRWNPQITWRGNSYRTKIWNRLNDTNKLFVQCCTICTIYIYRILCKKVRNLSAKMFCMHLTLDGYGPFISYFVRVKQETTSLFCAYKAMHALAKARFVHLYGLQIQRRRRRQRHHKIV